MNKYFPPYNNSSENIKVQLDLSNYATKKDIKDITHVDTSSYASKTNLASLKSEVDKLDTDKLKTVLADLAKLKNVVDNDVVKKTDYNAKITELNDKIPNITNLVTKSSVTTLIRDLDDRLDKVKKDLKDLDDTLDKVDKRIPDISGLATKSSITALLPRSTFNSKITEVENKITAVDNKIPDVAGFAKKSDYATDITAIKNDYATNASLDSKLNDLKAQHIADEVRKVDDKAAKHANDILGFESRLKQKEDIIDDVQRDNALTNGRDYYRDEMYLVYECRAYSFKYTGGKINLWKSSGLNNYARNSDMDAVSVTDLDLPSLVDNGRMSVVLDGAYFKQTKLIKPNNNSVINIYCVYSLERITNLRNTDSTVQNALFGDVKITKNSTETSKHKYEGHGMCFDEGGTSSKGGINNGRNVMIFGLHENSPTHETNKANNIYVMGDFIVQRINDTTMYAEKVYSQNFTAPDKKFVLSLHYNGDNSYLFVNGKL